MKNYIAHVKSNCKTWEVIWWWILRGFMLFGILDSLIGITGEPNMQQVAQMCANFVGMFAWEICMATSKKNFMHYLPSYIQDFSVVGFFMASFGGAYLNLYYSFRFYDLIFHIFGGAAGALFGYEALVAMQHRDKVKSHIPFVVLAAFGFSFICGNAWELLEFVLDQVLGSDAQHWNIQEAVKAAETYGEPFLANPHIIPQKAFFAGEELTELYACRWSLMDTMEDLVCNTIGGVIVYVFLLVCPYHHKGKNNVNNLYDNIVTEKTSKKAKKEAALK